MRRHWHAGPAVPWVLIHDHLSLCGYMVPMEGPSPPILRTLWNTPALPSNAWPLDLLVRLNSTRCSLQLHALAGAEQQVQIPEKPGVVITSFCQTTAIYFRAPDHSPFSQLSRSKFTEPACYCTALAPLAAFWSILNWRRIRSSATASAANRGRVSRKAKHAATCVDNTSPAMLGNSLIGSNEPPSL